MLQNSQEKACARVSFSIKLKANFIKKETEAQVFSCDLCEIFEDAFFKENLWWLIPYEYI